MPESILGDLADTPGVARAADLVTKAGTSARTDGRALYAAVRTLPCPRNRWRGSGTERVESLTDELAAPAYDILEPDELDQLVEDLEPLAAVLVAAGSSRHADIRT
ncbi:MAG: helix-turn-helix domain-containing protein [Acidimicrobiales bacterium]